MSKGMIRAATAVFLLSLSTAWAADIWKTVDKDGNVIYTDQPPKDGSKPMDLPELSVIKTDIKTITKPARGNMDSAPSPAQLRKIYGDFRITRPLPEETFWGTANTVVVTWGSKIPLTPDLIVRLFVDGKAQEGPVSGSISLNLDRGQHRVSAELRDARNRKILKTESVIFFVKQNAVGFNRRGPTPSVGSG